MLMTFRTARILLTTAIALAAWGARPSPAIAQDAKRGQEVYAAQKCQICHSIAGQGSKTSPLDGVGKKLSADEIRQWIVSPGEMSKKTASTKKPPMPDRYAKLPPADIDALVAYMQSLK
jgi:mono/diheme cytochrome c family protein